MTDVTIRPASLDEFDRIAPMREAMAREEGHDWDREYPGWQPRFAEFACARAIPGNRCIGRWDSFPAARWS